MVKIFTLLWHVDQIKFLEYWVKFYLKSLYICVLVWVFNVMM